MMYRRDQERLERLQPFLQSGEKVLWSGIPKPCAIFSRGDIFTVPFAVIWTAISLFWFFGASSATRDDEGLWAFLFPLFGLPFIVFGLYMLLGQFFFKSWRSRRTIYAVTDRKVAVLVVLPFGSRYRASDIAGIKDVQQDIKADGSGSIVFGSGGPGTGIFSNDSIDIFGVSDEFPVRFQSVRDVRAVYDLVIRQRNELNRHAI